MHAETGEDVPNGAVTVDLQGAASSQFQYVSLLAPVVLEANTRYFLVSLETAGGDEWYNVERTTLTTRSVAVLDGGVFGGPPWSSGGLPGHGYVPLDFVYLTDEVMPATAPSIMPRMINGEFELVLEGEVGRTYGIWATEDFVNWMLVTEVTLTSQRDVVVDPIADQFTVRFYRAEAR